MSGVVVQVLMGTYNGGEFLSRQIESILAQQGVEVHLHVRDDGSTDDTLALLEGWKAADPRITVSAGQNLGLPWSFFQLIEESDAKAQYWALADQDDVWKPDKLHRAVTHLADVNEPALYCARVTIVDHSLAEIRRKNRKLRRGPSFENSMVENIVTGSTIVLNSPGRAALLGRWPAFCLMHDAWLYLVLAGIGTVVLDRAEVLLYRQHAENHIGAPAQGVRRVFDRCRKHLWSPAPRPHTRQALELMKTHRSMLRPSARAELERFLASRENLTGRIRYARHGNAHRQSRTDNLIFKLLGLLNRI